MTVVIMRALTYCFSSNLSFQCSPELTMRGATDAPVTTAAMRALVGEFMTTVDTKIKEAVAPITANMNTNSAELVRRINLARAELKEHDARTKVKATSPIAANAEGEFHRVPQSYVIILQTPDQAKEFRIQAGVTTMQWIDPRNQRQYTLRARGDLPEDVRDKQRALSKLFIPIRDLCQKSANWPPNCRVEVDGFKGRLFVTNGDDIWTLIATNQISMDKFNFVPVGDELSDRGVNMPQVFSICTWNCQTLFYSIHSPISRSKPTFDVARRLMGKRSIARVQGVHGCPGDLRTLRSELPDVEVFGSFDSSECAGGIVALVQSKLFS
ncbi:unnamed protein product, partial [Prorocentrum cordatum]